MARHRQYYLSLVKNGGVYEKVVFKTLKDVGIGPSFLGVNLKEISEEKDDEFDRIASLANQCAYEFMKNNQDSLGGNTVQKVINDEQTFKEITVVQESCIAKVKCKKRK